MALIKKVLIAEDEDAIAHLVAAVLGDAGFLCLRARNGEEAVAMAHTEQPDLLVLDVMMPVLDGIEVVRRLKADVVLSRVPILMLTSLSSVDQKVKGLEAGADDYLGKPFDLREMTARVRALVRSSRRERDRNPTTHLPGATAIEEHLAERFRRKQGFSLMYCDLQHFDAFADRFGFRRADEVIARLGELILEQARAREHEPAFVGHVGGDDFVVVARLEDGPGLARDVVASFDRHASSFYEGGRPAELPLMTMTAIVVDSAAAAAASTDDLAGCVAAAKKRVGAPSASVVQPWPA